MITNKNDYSRSKIRQYIYQMYESGVLLTISNANSLHPGIVYASKRHFDNWLNAIEKSGVPLRAMHRTNWTKEKIIHEIADLIMSGESIIAKDVMKFYPRLYEAAKKLFGGYGNAVYATGIDYSNYGLKRWTKEEIQNSIRFLALSQFPMNYHWIKNNRTDLYKAARRQFGTWEKAIEAVGIDYSEVRLNRKWSSQEIINTIETLYRNGKRLDYTYISDTNSKLYAAAVRHFGSWRIAINAAGIDYNKIMNYKSIWSKQKIIKTIKEMKDSGYSLKYVDVKRNDRSLLRAAESHLGSWMRAVEAAGFEYSNIRSFTKWTERKVLDEIESIIVKGDKINPGHIFYNYNSLYQAAIKRFGSWNSAVYEAKLLMLNKNIEQKMQASIMDKTQVKSYYQ